MYLTPLYFFVCSVIWCEPQILVVQLIDVSLYRLLLTRHGHFAKVNGLYTPAAIAMKFEGAGKYLAVQWLDVQSCVHQSWVFILVCCCHNLLWSLYFEGRFFEQQNWHLLTNSNASEMQFLQWNTPPVDFYASFASMFVFYVMIFIHSFDSLKFCFQPLAFENVLYVMGVNFFFSSSLFNNKHYFGAFLWTLRFHFAGEVNFL